MSNFPQGIWYVTVEGKRFEGEIWQVDGIPVNCGIALWTLRVQLGSHMVAVTAPRTCFRKVRP